MRLHLFLLAVVLLALLLIPGPVFAQEVYKLTVVCYFKDSNVPVEGVLVKVVRGNETVTMGYTGSDGSITFLLPEGNYTVKLKYYEYSRSVNVTLNKDLTLVFRDVEVAKGKPVVANIPLKLKIPVLGSLKIVFPRALKIEASIGLEHPGFKYELHVMDNEAVFKCNETGFINVTLAAFYPGTGAYKVDVVVETAEGWMGFKTSLPFYGSKCVVYAELEVVKAPHYPTPEEIALAQEKLMAEFAEKIVNATKQHQRRLEEFANRMVNITSREAFQTRMELKRLRGEMEDIKQSVSSSLNALSKSLAEFKEGVGYLTGNIWYTLAIFGAAICSISFTIVAFLRSYVEIKPIAKVFPSRPLKVKHTEEFKELSRRIKELESLLKKGKESGEKRAPKPPAKFKINYVQGLALIASAYALWFIMYYVFKLPIPKPPFP